MAAILFFAIVCVTSGYAAPSTAATSTQASRRFDASIHLGRIISCVAEFDRSNARTNDVGDLFAGDGNLCAAAVKRGYRAWKYDMLYDNIKQNILEERQRLPKVAIWPPIGVPINRSSPYTCPIPRSPPNDTSQKG